MSDGEPDLSIVELDVPVPELELELDLSVVEPDEPIGFWVSVELLPGWVALGDVLLCGF